MRKLNRESNRDSETAFPKKLKFDTGMIRVSYFLKHFLPPLILKSLQSEDSSICFSWSRAIMGNSCVIFEEPTDNVSKYYTKNSTCLNKQLINDEVVSSKWPNGING